MRTFTAALALGLAISPVALAAEDGPDNPMIAVLGPSHHRCGDWTRSRENAKLFVLQLTMRTWAIGFLSGIAVSSSPDLLRGLTPEDVWAWMDEYCHAHPVASISDALQGPFQAEIAGKPNT